MFLNMILKIYILVITVLGFLLMGVDKRKAKKHLYRIPEKTLFLLAVMGGSLGSIIGMYFFHHKTRHTKFTFGMPAILIIQIIFFYVAKNFLCEIL